MNKAASSVKGKAGGVEAAYNRALKNYEEAQKMCVRLKKEGEEVPDEGEKDFSAPGAYKPPGVRAAKARDAAKQELARTKAAFGKAAGPVAAKEERLKELKDKMK